MTIGGALSDLNNLLSADDIPFYYKPLIKAVMDTIALHHFEIPKKATNGDVIKTMFPRNNMLVNESLGEKGTVFFESEDNVILYSLDWWDAPWKGQKMSVVSKSVEISLNAEERELLEKAIAKCEEIAHQCNMEGIFACKESVFECLSQNYDSNRGKLSAQIEVEE